MTRGTSTELIRTTAKLVFGAFLFLFVASFLVMPCMQSAGGLFVSASNAPLQGASSVPVATTLPRTAARGALPMTALGASLLATPASSAALPAASIQYASAWRAPAPPLSVPAQKQVSARAYRPSLPAAASCMEYKLFKPQMNVFKTFEVPAAEHPFRFAIILAFVFGSVALTLVPTRTPLRARPGWIRLRSLPFASSDPPHLASFAAQRDV